MLALEEAVVTAEGAEIIVGVAGVALLVIISLIVSSSQDKKLEDPKDDSIVYIDQLKEVSLLSGDLQFAVVVYRQSGNVHRNLICDSAQEAVKEAATVFRRAKIEYAVIDANSESYFSFRRGLHCHKGRSEGRKVGCIEIRRGRHVIENGIDTFITS